MGGGWWEAGQEEEEAVGESDCSVGLSPSHREPGIIPLLPHTVSTGLQAASTTSCSPSQVVGGCLLDLITQTQGESPSGRSQQLCLACSKVASLHGISPNTLTLLSSRLTPLVCRRLLVSKSKFIGSLSQSGPSSSLSAGGPGEIQRNALLEKNLSHPCLLTISQFSVSPHSFSTSLYLKPRILVSSIQYTI